jgi:FkbM family methyltransferase
MDNTDFSVNYWQFIAQILPDCDRKFMSHLAVSLDCTCWEEPRSALDFNNVAVAALIEAEQCENWGMQQLYLEMAFESLNQGVELNEHPLCAAHLAMMLTMNGEIEKAIHIAFSTFDRTLQEAYIQFKAIPPGLVYLPPTPPQWSVSDRCRGLSDSLKVQEGLTQALSLLQAIIYRLQYESIGRFESVITYTKLQLKCLKIGAKTFQDCIEIYLKVTASLLKKGRLDRILILDKSKEIAGYSAALIQSMYLSFRDFEELELAQFWLAFARDRRPSNDDLDWKWTELDLHSHFTYVPFESEILLAVEPTCNSIVTSVLIATGDWFEKELEFWRHQIQPGMTVIDVGANAGVYTFSAAKQVGVQGLVLAIEPFSGCIHCLEATCRINQMNWVKIFAGAASDLEGKARLSLHQSSELNEITPEDKISEESGEKFEEISKFTLDSLIEKENLTRVDFLKIDVEGHELSVLAGSEKIISEFSPVILYENIGGSRSNHTPVADCLLERGYRLFCYQPYTDNLIPLNSKEDLQGHLNIIAVPIEKMSNFSLSSD